MKDITYTALLVAGVVSCLCLVCCGGETKTPAPKEENIVGTYELDIAATKDAWLKHSESMDDEDPRLQGLGPQLKALEQGKLRVTTTLSADGTVTNESTIDGDVATASGHWTRSGSSLVLSLEVRVGPDQKPMPGIVRSDCTIEEGVLTVLLEGRVAWVMKRVESER